MYQEPRLILVGIGGVGSDFLEQLALTPRRYHEVVVADTKHVVAGLNSSEGLSNVLHAKRNGGLQLLLGMQLDETANLPNYFLPGSIVVNVTPTVFRANGSEGDIPPSVRYDIEALSRGAHVVPAHKSSFGSPALYEMVRQAASESGAMYLPAGVFMGPTRTAEILEWLNGKGVGVILAQGVVNGTVNSVIGAVVQRGLTYEEAMREQVDLGNAEKPDGSADGKGYDTGAKMMVPALIFKNYGGKDIFGLADERSNLPPNARSMVRGNNHLGIEGITRELLAVLEQEGLGLKLVGNYDGRTGIVTVGPVALPLSDPMAQVSRTNSIVILDLDMGVDIPHMLSEVYTGHTVRQANGGETKGYVVTTEYPATTNGRLQFKSFDIKLDYDPKTNRLTIMGPGAGAAETAAGLLGAVNRVIKSREIRDANPITLSDRLAMVGKGRPVGLNFQDSM